jgi:hypothetical protein
MGSGEFLLIIDVLIVMGVMLFLINKPMTEQMRKTLTWIIILGVVMWLVHVIYQILTIKSATP